ncbi:NADP-dependent oxidoreductase [Bryobacter aggregatus]|uniref:NADP-dependent oxidoreductase n=1 Tax=Bryobacter aggregatus TaxID=360054 RepID=UPI0004E1CD29|nr:NADP-dependent oxidoreductase [Bryobacter aggregatus]
MTLQNKQILLAARPTGFPKGSDFRLVTTPVRPLEEGEVLVKAIYLSVDPYMRGRMSEEESYAAPVALGAVMTGAAVGVVLDSKDINYPCGTYLAGEFGWQEYFIGKAASLRLVDPDLAPLSTALGVLGMTGLTAYFGLLEIGELKHGESVVISGAAGAVGSIAGQIAKLYHCSVVGIAGTEDKLAYITEELGFDAAFNYKTTRDYSAKLKELCPKGIDVYFDNVGGAITDAAIPLLNLHGRVPVCGQISQYNLEEPELGPRWLHHLIIKRAKVQGFLVRDFAAKFPKALQQLGQWYGEGKLKFPEQIAEGGIEAAPAAFIGMLHGENLGKQLVRIAPELPSPALMQ